MNTVQTKWFVILLAVLVVVAGLEVLVLVKVKSVATNIHPSTAIHWAEKLAEAPFAKTANSNKIDISKDDWDPLKEMESLQNRINRMFGNSLGKFNYAPALSEYEPRVDVKETKDKYIVDVDLPGVEKDTTNVSLKGQELTISGKREEQQEKETGNEVMQERMSGSFSRTLHLDQPVQQQGITTTLNKGVMEIVVLKSKT